MPQHLATIEMCVVYSSLAVFDSELENAFNTWTQQHVAQGFSWREGSVSFGTVGSVELSTEVWLSEQVELLTHTERAIQVPFTVGQSAQVGISDICGVEETVDLPSGTYLLLFENGFRYDVECSEEDHNSGLRPSWGRLTFVPTANPQPEILLDISAGAESGLLAPTYPLLMKADPA